jgi:hypothetical protein
MSDGGEIVILARQDARSHFDLLHLRAQPGQRLR